MNRVARTDHECQRRHDARKDVQRKAHSGDDSHRPYRSDHRRDAGYDRRPQAAGHECQKRYGQAETDRVEEQYVAPQRPRRLLSQRWQAGEFKRQPSGASPFGREQGLDSRHGLTERGRLDGVGLQPHEHDRRPPMVGEQVTYDKRVIDGASAGGLAVRDPEFALDLGNHWQDRPRYPLTADVEHRTHLLDAIQCLESPGQRANRCDGWSIEEVSRFRRDVHDALAIGGTEPTGHLIDEPEVGVRITQQRPQVIVDLQPRQAEHREQCHESDRYGDEAPP